MVNVKLSFEAFSATSFSAAKINFSKSLSLLALKVAITSACPGEVPNAISPNGDGMNDVFDLSSYDVSKLEIFNRFGTLVYSKENYTNEWHGQSNSGEELPVGTYYFTMEYQDGKRKAAWVYIQRLK